MKYEKTAEPEDDKHNSQYQKHNDLLSSYRVARLYQINKS